MSWTVALLDSESVVNRAVSACVVEGRGGIVLSRNRKGGMNRYNYPMTETLRLLIQTHCAKMIFKHGPYDFVGERLRKL
jgi:hypothetical protein